MDKKSQPKNFRRIFKIIILGILKFIFGIGVPVIAFLGSFFLTPDFRGEGGAQSFAEMLTVSKVVFAPLALWAVVCFFTTQITPRKKYRRVEVLGLWTGAAVSMWSIIFALFSPQTLEAYGNSVMKPLSSSLHGAEYFIFLVIMPIIFAPFYTLGWYLYAARKVSTVTGTKLADDFFVSQLISLPFVPGAILYAQKLFNELPTDRPDCYVVTAAYQADPRLVRSISINEQCFPAQLICYKAFELYVEKFWPRLHYFVRQSYDKAGPKLARWISKKQWRLNIAYVLLIPGQFFCVAALFLIQKAKRGVHNSLPPTISP